MLNQSLRAATALSGWRILRSVVTFFIVSALIVFGTQIVVGHPAKAQDKIVNEPVTPQNQDKKNLYISNITLRRHGDSTGELPLVVNDTAGTLALDWSNTFPGSLEERPVAGKSFTVELPKELVFAQRGVDIKPIPMKHDSGKVVGECTFEMRRAVCAFDGRAEKLWSEEGARNFRGTFSSWVEMTVPTEGKGSTLPFVVNGQNLDITLPGGVIKDQAHPGEGTPWYKSVGSVNPGADTLHWYFKITGKYLQDQFKAKNITQTMDGRTPFTIILKDVAESPLYFEADKLKGLSIRKQEFTRTCTVEEAETPNQRGSVCGNVSKPFDGSTIEYKIDPNDPKKIDIIITGPFSPDDTYSINGLNTTVHGKINSGIKYKNTAKIVYQAPDGTTKDVNDKYVRTAVHVDKRKAKVEYDQERGFFVVEKRVDGDILAIDPEKTSFDVEFKYEFPEGRTFTDWKDLEPLKAMSTNVTEHGGTATFKVGAFKQGFPSMAKEGQPLVNIPFPTGTKITLQEQIDTNAPFQHAQAKAGEFYWGEPRYAVDKEAKDQAKAGPVSFTIQKATNEKVETKVYLHNEVENRNGTFKVKKTVQGVVGEAGNGKSFKFTYTCSDNQSGEVDVPGNGEAVAVDKQFPIGTTCDVQEADAIEPIENHDLVKPAPQQVQIAADEQTLTFVNAYKSRGTFEVAKRVEGVEEAALQGKTYSFDYVCGPEKGRIENVIPGGPAVPAPATFPTGTTCTVTESLEAAKVEGYTVAPHKPVEVTIGAPGAPLVKAEFVNNYTRDLGSFKIRKSVKGDGNFTNDSFDVQYRCGAAEPVTLNLKGNEEWTVVENLPTGTVCEISEDQAGAKRAGFTEAIKIDHSTVKIDKTKVAEVTVTNTYAQNKGGFTISKSLAGTGQYRAKDKEFTFSYKCTDPQGDVVKEEKQLKVKAGEVKRITDVPELATCVVEELDGEVQNADLKTVVNVELEDGEPAAPVAEKPASPDVPANNGAPAAEAPENAVAPAENAPADNAAAPQPVVAVPVADPLEDAGEAANENPAEGDAVQPAPAPTPAPAPVQPDIAVTPAENVPAGDAPAVISPEKPEKQDAPVVVGEGVVAGNKGTFTIGKDTTHKVLVVNEYTDHVGSLSVTKIVEGDSVEMMKDQPFIFDIKCQDGQSKVLEVLGNGTPVDSGLRIPVGTKCEVSEQTDKAQRAGFDLKAPEKQEVTIAKRDEVVAATFKNEYTKHVGTFSVAKTVKGLPAEEAKDKEFLFNYSCSGGQKGEIKVKGDGVAVDAGVKIPVGTDCTVTENAASAKVKGFTVKLPENQNIRFENKDEKKELSFTNEYKPEPSVPMPGDPDPKNPPKNTPPNPGILGFLPFIPFLFGNAGSSDAPNGTNSNTVAGTNNTTNGTNNTASPAAQKSVLANTGASVIGIGLLALVVTSVGIFLAVRGRKSKS
ncbi:DUF5979 domain-containing protein [Corynebacterium freiburgense]|uniref:DUF5979 domain-containing protein n=1 Tax=Corynebacterium freiburgense TaxID=556548 RepID=UPI00041579BB|nr:DUF5979 domain-containing protein [Corynebacterium freiburgense]WJZ01611.1 T surface-antigen of pili [Corynebacterium freiburgense]